jgi:hypothetical protein
MLTLKYQTSHGGEDTQGTYKPSEWEDIVKNFEGLL